MCWSCFKLYADKPVINEQVQHAFDVIRQCKQHNLFSGRMHTIVEDMNVDDWQFSEKAREKLFSYEHVLFDTMAALSEPERATAVAMDWGYLTRDGVLRDDIALSEKP